MCQSAKSNSFNLRASHRRCEDQAGEYRTCPRLVLEGTRDRATPSRRRHRTAACLAGWVCATRNPHRVSTRPSVVAPESPALSAASSKYFRGDSPRRTSVVPAPATTNRSDRSLDHRQRRPVAGSYSSSNQPRPNASIEPDSRWTSNWRIASSPAAPPPAFRRGQPQGGVGALPRRDAVRQPDHVQKAGASRPVVVRPGVDHEPSSSSVSWWRGRPGRPDNSPPPESRRARAGGAPGPRWAGDPGRYRSARTRPPASGVSDHPSPTIQSGGDRRYHSAPIGRAPPNSGRSATSQG